jgi:hypothetical protein
MAKDNLPFKSVPTAVAKAELRPLRAMIADCSSERLEPPFGHRPNHHD